MGRQTSWKSVHKFLGTNGRTLALLAGAAWGRGSGRGGAAAVESDASETGASEARCLA
jgi:hypothetical protein